MFERLNTTGTPLSSQEVRNAVYQGPLNELIINLSTDPFFQDQLSRGESRRVQLRMLDVEYVLRYLQAAYGHERPLLSSRDLNEFMARGWAISSREIDEYENGFKRSLRRCQTIWGEEAFIAPQRAPNRKPRFSLSLFLTQMLLCRNLSDAAVDKLSAVDPAKLQDATYRFAMDPVSGAQRSPSISVGDLTDIYVSILQNDGISLGSEG